MRDIREIIVHCTGTDLPGQNVEVITIWHEERGWNSCGYSYVITNEGKLEKARGMEVIPAQCFGHNEHGIGICLAGDKKFSDDQFKTLKMLLEFLKRIYPSALLYGHNELDNQGKTCPNFSIAEWKTFWDGLSK